MSFCDLKNQNVSMILPMRLFLSTCASGPNSWRRAIAASKCIVRVKVNAQYGYGPEEDEDANFEFRFEETRTEVVEESTGKKRWVDLSRAELVNTATGAVKVCACRHEVAVVLKGRRYTTFVYSFFSSGLAGTIICDL